MTDLKNNEDAQRWMAQWKHAAKELPKRRAQELRELTDERATEIAIGLAPPLPYRLRQSTGLKEWQAWMTQLASKYSEPDE